MLGIVDILINILFKKTNILSSLIFYLKKLTFNKYKNLHRNCYKLIIYNLSGAKMDVQGITPKEFDDKLRFAEKNFKSDRIPITITIMSDPYPFKKIIPEEIRYEMDDSMNTVKIEGDVLPSLSVSRFGGGREFKYAYKNYTSGKYFFRFYPKDIPMRKNLKAFNISVDAVSSLDIEMSPYFTAAPVNVRQEHINESVTDTFLAFLESLKRSEEDVVLIESVKKGYINCMANFS